MFGSPKRNWLKPLARRNRQPIRSRRLMVTALEERDVPAAFTPGDLVIYRVGDGTAPLAGTGAAVFLDEYSPAGTLIQSIPVPTSTLVATGNSTTEGGIDLSQDGSHLVFTGFASTVGGTTSAATNNRVFETADPTGALATLATLPGSATVGGGTSDLRAASAVTGTSNDPGLYFTTNSNVAYLPSGATNGVNIEARNSRYVQVQGNTLYASNASTATTGKLQVYGTVGTLPTGTATPSPVITTVSANGINGFFLAQINSGSGGIDTAYGLDPTAEVMYKYNLVGGTWTQEGSPISIAPNTGAGGAGPGLTGIVSGTNVTLFLTINGSQLYSFTDNSGFMGAMSGGLSGVLASAGTNTAFRGIATVPKSSTGTGATTVTVSPSSNNVPVGTSVTFTATVDPGAGNPLPTGSVAFKYNGATFGSAPVTQIGSTNKGQAQFSYSGLPIGNNETITAVYSGDPNYASNSNTTSVTVTGSATTTVATSDGQQQSVGTSVHFTATVMATSGTATPAGTVVFYDDGLALNSPGIAVSGSGTTATALLTTSTNTIQAAQKLTPGSHTITAIFTPNPGFTGSNGNMVQNIKANPFGAGDLLVYRVGDGTSTLSATGNVVYIDEFKSGTANANQTSPLQSIVMPSLPVSGGNQALLSSAQQSTEGQLTLSADGQWVYLTGYDTTLGGAVTVNTASATQIPRTIGRIRYDGFIDTSMALTDLASGGSVRGVASPDGTQFYATGSTGGVRYISSYTAGLQTSTQVDSGANGTNGYTGAVPWTNLVISNGQLFGTDNSSVTVSSVVQNTVKVATIGTGLPTTAGNTVAIVPGLPTGVASSSGNQDLNAPSFPYGLFFAHLNAGPETLPDTMYVADEGINFFGGQITKWALVTGSYTKVAVINSNGVTQNDPIPSFNQLNGTVNGTTVNLYATYGNGGSPTGPGLLYSITDTGGYNANIPDPTVTTLASVGVGSNEVYRGVAPVPVAAPTPVNVGSIQVNDGSAQRSEVRSISVTFTGPVTFSGSGTVNQNAAAAFELDHINDLSSHFATPRAVGLTASVTTNGSGNTVVTLTFSGAETDAFSTSGNGGPFSLPIAGPSLSDGRYTLTAFASHISGPGGGQFNGNTNFATTPDTFGGTGSKLYREFGDQTGDGVNDSTDLGQFRSTFNANSSLQNYLQSLDSNNDGVVDSTDLGQYRSRFNLNVYQ
jgi:hypothetical protein